jgi:predicted nucleic-acid-binding Zn-ribbon protein
MNRLNCVNCGSEKVIPDVQVQDQGQSSDGMLRARVDEYPHALLFKGTVFGYLKARICGECGYAEFYVDSPKELYETYLRAKKVAEEHKP